MSLHSNQLAHIFPWNLRISSIHVSAELLPSEFRKRDTKNPRERSVYAGCGGAGGSRTHVRFHPQLDFEFYHSVGK